MANSRSATVYPDDEGQWLQWLGHPVRYLATAEQTGGFFCMSIGTAHKNQGAPPHSHDFDEGFYVLRGLVQFTAGNQSVTLGEGDFINIGGGTVHAPKVLSDDGADLLTIAAPAGFDGFQMEAGERLSSRHSVPSKTEEEIRTDINRIAADYGIDMNPPEEAFSRAPNIQVTRADEGEIIDAVGDRYRFLAEGEHTKGRYAIWHATVSPGGGPPPHIHRREDEAFYVLSGQLEFHADGKSFVDGPGTFVNLPIGSLHRFNNPSDEPATVLILVAPSGLEKMFRYTGARVVEPSSPIGKPTDEQKQRLVGVAAGYGIELHLG